MEHIQHNHSDCLLSSYSAKSIAPPPLDSAPSFDQPQKKDAVLNTASIAKPVSKDAFNCASIHMGTDQTISASNNVNNIFAIQQSFVSGKK